MKYIPEKCLKELEEAWATMNHERLAVLAKNALPAFITAYLAERENKEQAEGAVKAIEIIAKRERERAERYGQALNCGNCGGTGQDPAYMAMSKPCLKCAEIRKEARGE